MGGRKEVKAPIERPYRLSDERKYRGLINEKTTVYTFETIMPQSFSRMLEPLGATRFPNSDRASQTIELRLKRRRCQLDIAMNPEHIEHAHVGCEDRQHFLAKMVVVGPLSDRMNREGVAQVV